jgi:SAM-dependent methyltransferase
VTDLQRAADYWDANREKTKDPAFWMAHPLCRRAINRRVSGSEHEWPLDWFRRIIGPKSFGRGVSWGCGLGAFERAAIRIGIVREIDAFDLSPASLEDARKEAAREGITGVDYRLGNFDDPRLESRRYDIVFFHASLHHVAALERLFRRLTFALKPGGAIYVDEYMGPSRFHWTEADLKLGQAVLDMLPPEEKLRSRLEFPIEVNDPSESYRSDEIPKFVREFFDIVEWRPYGGQLTDLVMPCISSEWATSEAGSPFVQRMLDIEDRELSRDSSSSHHLVVYGTVKSALGLAWPLGRQAFRAARRRLMPR